MTAVTLTLTDFLLREFAIEEDGRARTFRDMAEVLRGQGMPTAADWLDEQAARVLAECEAKRRIVERYLQAERLRQANAEAHAEASHGGVANQEQTMALRRHGYELQGRLDGLRFAVDEIGAVYADRPGYRQEWRP